ncbi:MAG: hypothetical protein EAZ51_08175 [Sphingobacteriales bacterium]|nr:MAG: hypothetical protein EAZ64_00725 [Sphingobacteriales bacterium]TAF79134.1 MAG: hypothetical protein EAZ51_08175 [Sphingobacteriales bacterium]
MLHLSVEHSHFQKYRVFVISQVSPLAKLLIGKKTGENFLVNNQTHKILNIF